MRPRFTLRLVAGAALVAVFLPSGGPAGAQGGTCQQYDVTGTWATHQGNGYDPTFNLKQSGTSISGSATLPGGQAARAGYTGSTGSVSGSLSGDRIDVTVAWPPKADGSGSAGRYKGEIQPTSATTGKLSGGQAGTVSWTGSGPAKCTRFASKPDVKVVPPPAGFDTAVTVPAPAPGGVATNTSPPLGNANKVTSVTTGLTADDVVFIAGLRHECYQMFVRGLANFETKITRLRDNTLDFREEPEVDLPKTLSDLALCLALVEAFEEVASKASVSHVGADAAAARCHTAPLYVTLTRQPRRKVTLRRIRRGALTVKCARVAGGLAITYSTRSGGPLRKVVGSRLRVSVRRSKRDAPGGTLTFGYHKVS